MPTDPVEICNLALLEIGEQPITAFSDNSTAARVATRFYEPTRDDLLRGHNWNFAQVRVVLAQDATAPVWGDDFPYSYTLPADCLFVLETNIDEADPWRLEGRHLITAAATVSILYVARVTDVSLYDANFVDALVYELAFRFHYPITRNATLGDVLLRKAQASLQRAKSRDGQEARALKTLTSDRLTRVR